MPCGLSDGLPVGEATVLRVADAYERAAGFADLHPPMAVAASPPAPGPVGRA